MRNFFARYRCGILVAIMLILQQIHDRDDREQNAGREERIRAGEKRSLEEAAQRKQVLEMINSQHEYTKNREQYDLSMKRQNDILEKSRTYLEAEAARTNRSRPELETK